MSGAVGGFRFVKSVPSGLVHLQIPQLFESSIFTVYYTCKAVSDRIFWCDDSICNQFPRLWTPETVLTRWYT